MIHTNIYFKVTCHQGCRKGGCKRVQCTHCPWAVGAERVQKKPFLTRAKKKKNLKEKEKKKKEKKVEMRKMKIING